MPEDSCEVGPDEPVCDQGKLWKRAGKIQNSNMMLRGGGGSFLSGGSYEEVKKKNHVGDQGGIWNWIMDNTQTWKDIVSAWAMYETFVPAEI